MIVSRLGRRVVALVLLVDGARLVLLVLAGFAIGRWRGRGLAAMPGVAIGQVDADEVGDVRDTGLHRCGEGAGDTEPETKSGDTKS